MSGINFGRVLLGGLVAGTVANVLDFVWNAYLLVDESNEMAARLNLNPDTVQASWSTWVAVDYLYGLLLVFTYAAIRPRFGPGPKTAVTSGFLLWFAITIVCAGFMAMGMFTVQAYMKTSALTLVSAIVPSLVGAAIYKE